MIYHANNLNTHFRRSLSCSNFLSSSSRFLASSMRRLIVFSPSDSELEVESRTLQNHVKTLTNRENNCYCTRTKSPRILDNNYAMINWLIRCNLLLLSFDLERLRRRLLRAFSREPDLDRRRCFPLCRLRAFELLGDLDLDLPIATFILIRRLCP